MLPGFDGPEPAPQAARLGPKLKALADRGLFLGTSSWKYEGWLGSIYSPDRYATRSKFSKKRFEAECLAEYAQTFPVVGGDFSFYQFPSPSFWEKLFEESSPSLRFGLKVPEEITVPNWPGHARYGRRAGTVNEGFMDQSLFHEMFTWPLEKHRDRVAVMIFEFGTFARSTFPTAADFLARLDPFLGAVSKHFRFGVEIRNKEYLGPDYIATLRAHNVAHVFNAWTRMPELEDQIEMPGAFTADFSVTRALLAHGRSYEQAVETFEPYRSVQEPNPSARKALGKICERAWRTRQPAYVFINNRLEGNAPGTIEAVVDELGNLLAEL
jgi:uncharacterized protein YecE (DUF72 family)